MAVWRTQRVEGECFLALHRHAVNALDPFADVVLARRCLAMPLLVAVEGGEAADDVAGFGSLPIREGMIGTDFVRQLHLAAPDGQQVRAVRLCFHTGDLPGGRGAAFEFSTRNQRILRKFYISAHAMRQILQGIMQRIQRLHAVQPFRLGISDLIADLYLAPRVIPFQNEDFCLLPHGDAAVTLAGRSAQAESGVGICLILRFAVLSRQAVAARAKISREVSKTFQMCCMG